MATVAEPNATSSHQHAESTSKLAPGALGVVFGDIGTSPLYALKESFVGHHPLAVDPLLMLVLPWWSAFAVRATLLPPMA